ncbi:hypothetical protein NQ314_004497, partial [Rhamnusium bicolor]
TCLMKENVCALLCGKNDDERYTLLKQLYNNDPSADQDNSNCPSVQRAFTYSYRPIATLSSDESIENDLRTPLLVFARSSVIKKFINAGVWISTIVFLIFSIIFGVVATALSLWNTVSNPVQVYFSIFGLYIYNAAALCCLILSMTLWGIMHIVITFHDVGIFNTLTGQMTSDKTASLGYSYW